ncbi:lysis protein [Xenorhabdus sp. IM139775]|uniref:lysis protein n=1 Tax=Xenorhabdus sp. IM139775 TaxID=3025876 RepID=UPI0023598440|nr:lysis protein [Xenorhabdus sp. IM139775]MDC9593521.1 lysis protein [Xenorhabdus sp. IM139775]
MKFNFTYGVIVALIVASAAAVLYRSGYKKQIGINSNQATEIQQLTDTINYQNTHIEMLHELDTKHTQKIADDQIEINKLRDAALAHPERVYIQAKCPAPKTTAPSGLDDAATARPTDTAVRNYWLLRKRIAISEQMILGLQEYVKTQCK